MERSPEFEDLKDHLFEYEEADRPSALQDIEDRLTDSDYWKLVRLIWTYADEIWRNDHIWRTLLTRRRLSSRHEIMEPYEQDALAALDDSVRIYRGHTEFNSDGWSWTLRSSWAEKFARTVNGWPEKGTPKVTWARVKRAKIIAYFKAADEEEILIDPTDAYGQETITL